MRKMSKFAAVLLLLALGGLAVADDGFLGTEEFPVALSDLTLQDIVHYDAPDWKGTFTLIVQNTSNTAWTDFHFGIFTAQGQGDASSVFFANNVLNMVGYSAFHSIDSYAISADGSTLDIYFDSNPVQPLELVGFTIYTDNTLNKVNFGISFYPTVPEPATMALLALGGLFASRKRK